MGPAVTRTATPPQRAAAKTRFDPGRDLFRLQHPARADIAARLVSLSGAKQHDSPIEQRQHVRPGRARAPHLLVHRRHEHHGRGGRQAQGGQQVVGDSVGEPCEHIGGGRRDKHQVRPARELDVAHPRLGLLIKETVVNRIGGHRLEGERGHELARRRGHHDPHLELAFAQASNEVGSFVGRDAAGDTEHDSAVGETVHDR